MTYSLTLLTAIGMRVELTVLWYVGVNLQQCSVSSLVAIFKHCFEFLYNVLP